MKKTTVRFAAVGTVLLLSTLAIAFAQHDARQRRPEPSAPAIPLADTLQPILTDRVPQWTSAQRGSSSAPAVVRANDEHPFASPPSLAYDPTVDSPPAATGLANALRSSSTNKPRKQNALRSSPDTSTAQLGTDSQPDTSDATSAVKTPASDTADSLGGLAEAGESQDGVLPLGAFSDSSAVALASGVDDVSSPPVLPSASLPASPALMGTSTAMASAPSLPGASMATPTSAPASLPSTSGLLGAPPSLLPSGDAPTSGPNADGPPPPGWVNSGAVPSTSRSSVYADANRSLSDTQRAAMPATNLPSSSRPNEQAWMQAPPVSTSALGATATATLPSGGVPTGLPAPAQPGRIQPAQVLPEQGSLIGTGSRAALTTSGAATLGMPQPISHQPITAQLPSASRDSQSRGGSSSPFAGTAIGSLVSNQPGNRHLDGSQNPILLIQKRMAGECQVGKRATVVITVRNAGNSAAQNVEVIDSVPHGASFAEAIPAVTPTPDGVLIWQLGEMGPGDERTINLQIVPERQGELGSTAAVRFAAQASVRTLATLPKLELTPTAPPDVVIGSPYVIDVVVKNVGTGVARAVLLEADLPQNIRFESGDASLEASFGDIAPGESRRIRLDSVATEAGPAASTIRALTEDGVQQEHKVDLRVLAPALKAGITGPNKRYLDRQAKFTIMIENSGTAPATNCEFMMRLPAGLNFNTTNKEGIYDPSQHAVLWSVPDFPAGHADEIELTVLPVEVGNQQMTFQGSADLGVTTDARAGLAVEEQGELSFTIDQDADPVEITATTTYTVEVRNVGRVDRNVELIMQFPAGSQVVKVVDAPVVAKVEGDQLRFEPIPQMESRSAHKFRVEVRHAKVGTQIVRAQLKSQNRPTPVIKEEATDVYNDRE